MSTWDRDKKVVDLATKAAMAFRILRVTQRDLEFLSTGWEVILKEYQEGRGEEPQTVRKARIKANEAAENEFWDAMKELDKTIG